MSPPVAADGARSREVPVNVEIKARVGDMDALRKRVQVLAERSPQLLRQDDTFFEIPSGWLKLRVIDGQHGELIYYERDDECGPTPSEYLISPVDIIPDLLLPYIGWLDDGVVLGTIFYLIRYGRLPNFFFKKQGPYKQPFDRNNANFTFKKNQQQAKGPSDRKKASSSNIPKTPYDILGINPAASKKEIQKAYKEAIKKYHPDKLSHLGEDFSDLANEKFLEIQTAYDTLMKV